jgi:G3E family GTPase
MAAISRLVIEADEAADPASIFRAVMFHPYLSQRYAPDGIVAVIDGSRVASVLADRAETVRQVAMADVVAVSRWGEGLGGLVRLNPWAVVTDAAKVPAREIVGRVSFDATLDNVDAWLGAPISGVPRSGEAGRIHAFAVSRDRSLPLQSLDLFLEYLATLQGANLIRVRGAVATPDSDVAFVEGFGGSFLPPVVASFPAGELRSQFAVVARDLDRATFEGYFDAFLNEPRVDAPDRKALTENPLAIGGFRAR